MIEQKSIISSNSYFLINPAKYYSFYSNVFLKNPVPFKLDGIIAAYNEGEGTIISYLFPPLMN
jgi:hypothetical protein